MERLKQNNHDFCKHCGKAIHFTYPHWYHDESESRYCICSNEFELATPAQGAVIIHDEQKL